MPNDDRALTGLSINELPEFNSERNIATPDDFLVMWDSVRKKFFRIKSSDLVRISVTFESSIVLDGDELATRFVYSGSSNNQTVTLAVAAGLGDSYNIIVLNHTTSNNFSINLVVQGGDTMNGSGANIEIPKGSRAAIARDTSTNYIVAVVAP